MQGNYKKILDRLINIFNKKNKTDITKEKETRDMSQTHVPNFDIKNKVFKEHPEWEGITKERLKAEIEKDIEEKIKRISDIKYSDEVMKIESRLNKNENIEIKIKERRKKRKNNSVKEPSVILDQRIDRIFNVFEKAKNIILNSYNKASISSAKFVTKISKTKRCKITLKNITKIYYKLSKKEKFISSKLANFIEKADININKLEDFLSLKYDFILWQIERGIYYAENHKRKVIMYTVTGIVCVISITSLIGSLTAYEYMYNGKILGVVKNQEDVYKTIDAIGNKLNFEHNAEIKIDKNEDITFNKVFLLGKEIDDKEDVLNRLTYMKDMKVKGYSICINDKKIVILQSKKLIEDVLNTIENMYVSQDENIEYENIGFKENVTIKKVNTNLGELQNKKEVLNYLLTGQKEKKIHVVEQGQTISGIAKIYGLKQKDLLASNPDIDPEKIFIGQEITLTQNKPLLTVQTQEVVTYNEAIPYEIAYEDVSTKYEGENTVKMQGSNGEKEVVARIIKNNGVEVDKKEISSSIIKEPVSQIVLRGTKKLPPLVGTGTFIYPVRGTITSRFGPRWGGFHPAIDIGASTGTPIKASDGGKVIFSGYSGSYGYMIKIDHGGNKVTLYAHCSKIFVKVGDRVYQGQHIANVGSTGNSTGPHVHFEVQINGQQKNPLNYL
ncbi:M23 family metallopeptidase [Anaerovorax odorimutans]|uniref:M23 family metallopeptidase n=1 Tax=Anaerovorax odorimutans TaxID=109327 RepID=UPI00040ADCE9|nr:M23 family metallopeptidase [Anaerovorax odorimutans]